MENNINTVSEKVAEAITPDNLIVEGDINEHILSCFLEAWKGYPRLADYPMHLRYHAKLGNMTMRAQPKIDWNFFSKKNRHYRIDVQDHTVVNAHIRVRELSKEVLVGWFAHELGHIMDYLDRDWLNIAKFGIGYLTFPTFKMGAERKADLYAIEHGFADAINSTKHFLMNESDIPNSYKDRLNKYYMTIEEVELIVMGKESNSVHRDRVI